MPEAVRTYSRAVVASAGGAVLLAVLLLYFALVWVEFDLLPPHVMERVKYAGMLAHAPLLLAPVMLLVGPVFAWAARTQGRPLRIVVILAVSSVVAAAVLYAAGVALGYWIG